MKTMLDINKKKVPAVRIDPSLNKYDHVVLFPEKLEKANDMLKNTKFPNLGRPPKKRKQGV